MVTVFSQTLYKSCVAVYYLKTLFKDPLTMFLNSHSHEISQMFEGCIINK